MLEVNKNFLQSQNEPSTMKVNNNLSVIIIKGVKMLSLQQKNAFWLKKEQRTLIVVLRIVHNYVLNGEVRL